MQMVGIESNCPVDFEYEIEVTKPHPDIQIGPQRGDIRGMTSTYIEVKFTPTTFTTAEAEISFRTTEFDSQPKICRIVGNAVPHKQVALPTETPPPSQPKAASNEEYSVKKTKSRTLLTQKPERRPSSRAGVKLDKIPEKTTLGTPAHMSKAASKTMLS